MNRTRHFSLCCDIMVTWIIKTLRSPIGGDIQVKNRMNGLLYIVKVNNERQHFNPVKFLLDGKPQDIT